MKVAMVTEESTGNHVNVSNKSSHRSTSVYMQSASYFCLILTIK